MNRIALSLLAALALLPASVLAASLSVAPLRVDLGAAHPIDQVALVNSADTPVVMEAQLMAWDQDAAGQWVLTPAKGVDIYPAQVRIAPQQKGYVRIGLAAGAPASGAYRLVLQELADPATAKPGTVRILTRISLPVFVLPPPAQRQSAARLTARYAAGTLALTLENTGNLPIAPQDVRLRADARSLSGRMGGYALPGRTFSWTLPWPACRAGQTLQLELPDQDLAVSAPLQGCR